MRALFTVLAFLLPLLVGCDKLAPSGPPGSASAAARDDEAKFDKLMAEGARANLAGRSAGAEARIRDALSVRRQQCERAHLGTDCPLLALPLMSLGMQLSGQGQYPAADAQFEAADRALRTSDDPPMKARLAHYRGVHLLNQHKSAEAEVLLAKAEAAYTDLIPQYVLNRNPMPKTGRIPFDPNNVARAQATSGSRLLGDSPAVVADLLGLIEVRRNRAIALRDLNRFREADEMTASAERLARSNDLARPSVEARVYRTAGVTATQELSRSREREDVRRSGKAFEAAYPGATPGAEADLRRRELRDFRLSDDAFEVAYPSTKPGAETALLHAAAMSRAGETLRARRRCDRAVQVLVDIHAGTTPDLMAPCLDLYAGAGLGILGSADRTQMFLAAQVAQGSITSHQIAQASASLTASENNPQLHEALRQRDEHQRNVDQIYRALDAMSVAGASGAAEAIGEKQREADRERAALEAAEAAVRKLAPNFGQLVQDVAPASQVFGLLRPDEALVAVFLASDSGWTFALRNGSIAVSRIDGGAAAIDPLVTAVRAGLQQKPGGGLPDFDVASAKRLYDLVLGGVSGQINGATALVIAPAGPLLSLPFEVLLTGPADRAKLAEAPWLVKQATITHVPAPSNFVSLREIANHTVARKQQRWFGFGESLPITLAQAEASFPEAKCGNSARLLAGLPPLSGASNELEQSALRLGATRNDELLGAAFTAGQVARTPLKNRDILHFAAHALLPTDLRCQTDAAIVTSPSAGASDAKGALLTASEILSLDITANLVILSACDSGGAGGGSGESLSSLARSFFFRNAQSLLVTHWAISDPAAALLMGLTIDSMKNKPELGVTGALREAQLLLLRRVAAGEIHANYAHPYAWAPFAVIGEGGETGGGRMVSSRQ